MAESLNGFLSLENKSAIGAFNSLCKSFGITGCIYCLSKSFCMLVEASGFTTNITLHISIIIKDMSCWRNGFLSLDRYSAYRAMLTLCKTGYKTFGSNRFICYRSVVDLFNRLLIFKYMAAIRADYAFCKSFPLAGRIYRLSESLCVGMQASYVITVVTRIILIVIKAMSQRGFKML